MPASHPENGQTIVSVWQPVNFQQQNPGNNP
jgi:hypothetical protein